MTDPGRRVPAEFEPHECTVMCWPCRPELYRGAMAEARSAHATVAMAIAGYEPVTMIAPPSSADDAAAACGPTVEVVAMPIDDSWFRDTGPIMVFDEDRVLATHWQFNAWGEAFSPYDRDASIGCRWAEASGYRVESQPMVLEGGSLAFDGRGTALTTEECLLSPNRNPTLSGADIEARLATALGIDSLVWLPFGLADDRDTDGHVDNVAAFAPDGRVLLQRCDDPQLPDHGRMTANRSVLVGAGFDIVDVPILPFDDRFGERVPVPYLNYYVGNGFVAVPVCGNRADADMCALIGEHHPGRDVMPLDVGAILGFGGGGIHCITQQVPASLDSRARTDNE